MHPARAKAKQVLALVETAESVAAITTLLAEFEAKFTAAMAQYDAKLDEVVAFVKAAAEPAKTPKGK